MSEPIKIVRYTPNQKKDWDNFVECSKNGTFLFMRDYMEYHADRFVDRSYLFLRKNKIVALLPGSIQNNCYVSHAGLTYGGFVLSNETKVLDVLNCLQILIENLKNSEVQRILYKCVPHIYHKLPAEEDLYALFRVKAKLVRRDIATTIIPNCIPYSKLRKRKIKQSSKLNIEIRNGQNWHAFWNIIVQNLEQKYNVMPTHSVDEILYLEKLFPNNIHFFEAVEDDVVIGGIVAYVTDKCVHIQYPHASPKGKEVGAIDLLIDHLLKKEYPHISFFDFGISTESNGTILNESLIFMKEGFGGRAIAYDQYEIDLNRTDLLD